MEYAHPVYLGGQWEGCVFCFETESTTGIWRRMKGCEVAWFYHPAAVHVGLRSCELRGWGGWGRRGAQAATAHQRSNNTTDDRPRGKPRAASPSASKAAEWQLQQWKVIQTWMFGSCWGLFALETVLLPKSPSWKRVELRSKGHSKRRSITLVQ